MTERAYAPLHPEQMSKILCKNIHAFMRYHDFCVAVLFLNHPVYDMLT